MEEQRIAQALAATSRDRDVRLLEKNWDRVQGMESEKYELTRQARALQSALGLELGSDEVAGTKLPNGLRIGSWIEHSNGYWWGKIVYGYTARTGGSPFFTIAWHGRPEKGKEGEIEISPAMGLGELKKYNPYKGEGTPPLVGKPKK
jgi:hypothetical protein